MSKQEQLLQIRADLESAASVLPLAGNAKHIVPGEGNANATVLLIGEAPGYHESVEHRPFVGVSGKLLRKTLTEVGLSPEIVYISNIVKARPPDNRDPTPEEIKAYKPYLDREIDVIQPKIIVTLGRFSMAKFLPNVKISQIHGRLQKVVWKKKKIYVLPMYHPAAALRSVAMKTAFVSDFQKLPAIMQWLDEKIEDSVFAETVTSALT